MLKGARLLAALAALAALGVLAAPLAAAPEAAPGRVLHARCVRRHPQDLARRAPFLRGQRHEEVLRADVFIFQLFGRFERLLQHAIEAR